MSFSGYFFLVIIFFIKSAVINNNLEDDLRKTVTCLEESKVSSESLKNLESGNFDNDPRLKEYLLCVSKNAGFQDQRGYLQQDMIRRRLKGGHYSEDTINEILQQCLSHKETPQETAFQFMKCTYRNAFSKNYYNYT